MFQKTVTDVNKISILCHITSFCTVSCFPENQLTTFQFLITFIHLYILGACVLIHGQVVHHSKANKTEHSRHAYTFHVVDMNGTTYSSENWLQLNPDQPFPEVYKN